MQIPGAPEKGQEWQKEHKARSQEQTEGGPPKAKRLKFAPYAEDAVCRPPPAHLGEDFIKKQIAPITQILETATANAIEKKVLELNRTQTQAIQKYSKYSARLVSQCELHSLVTTIESKRQTFRVGKIYQLSELLKPREPQSSQFCRFALVPNKQGVPELIIFPFSTASQKGTYKTMQIGLNYDRPGALQAGLFIETRLNFSEKQLQKQVQKEVMYSKMFQGYGTVDPYYSLQLDNNRYLLVQPLYDSDLFEQRNSHQHMEQSDIASIAYNLTRALSRFHRAGYVHHDLKLENIFMKNGQALIGDYGLMVQQGTPNAIGTWFIMPPEVFKKSYKAQPSSDIWSLGLILLDLSNPNLNLGTVK
jgi:serine/threonine protein kinase